MAKSIFTNNAATTLANPVSIVDTSIVLVTGTGSIFPTPTGGDYFYITCVTATSTYEIMKVTARTSDSLTVVRAQEGTTALVFNNGDRVELRVTAASLNNMLQSDAIGTTVQAYNTTLAGIAAGTTTLGGFKNKIINGDMRVDQRNAGAVVTISSGSRSYTVDRWFGSASGGGAFSVDQSDLSSGGGGVGSAYGVTITTTTADSSVAAGDYYQFNQAIEGLNAADLYWGTASARRVTLSFRVAVSAGMVGRTFSGCIVDSAGTVSYPFTFVPSSASYTTYRISIPGATTGTWNRTTAEWGSVRFNLGSGSTFLGTSQGAAASDGTTTQSAGTWQAGNLIGATGSQGIIDTLSASITIKDVQLEAGSVATPFECRPYGTELALCQRYYELQSATKSLGFPCPSTGGYLHMFEFKWAVPKRAAPTCSWNIGSTNNVESYNTVSSTVDCMTVQVVGTTSTNTTFTVSNVSAASEL